MNNMNTTHGNRNWCTETIIKILEVINTSISLSVAISIRYNSVYKNAPSPDDYDDPSIYLLDAQAVALVRKNPWIFTNPDDLAAAALDKFLGAEESCKLSNHTFRLRLFTFEERSLLERARTYCSKILGVFEYGPLDFGPGSSRTLTGQDANVINKLCRIPECTKLCYEELVSEILNQIPHFAISSGFMSRGRGEVGLTTAVPDFFIGNRFTTVPKDCRTDRPICIEPLGNMMLQKAIGSSIRSRLKRYGLDLNSAPSRHAMWVEQGSRDGGISTIDLSSASDTISRELVRFLIPESWLEKLELSRCMYTELPNGNTHFNEKFSSMGNGYTFELESLIFYSLMLACRSIYGSRDCIVSVFGDDIIIDSSFFPQACRLLRVCGFEINQEKSFTTNSSFRESCGTDYLKGLSVRPIYIKELPADEKLTVVYMANRVREIAHIINFCYGCDIRFLPIWQAITRRLQPSFRLIGPPFYGDLVIAGSVSEWTHVRFSFSCMQVKVFRLNHKRRKRLPGDADKKLTCALYGVPSSGVVPRGAKADVVARYAPCFYNEGSHLTWC